MIGIHKTSWHTMLFSTLWAYRTSVKFATRFTPFRLVYGLEAILPIECEIPSLKLAVELLPNTSAEEEHLLCLMRLDEKSTRCYPSHRSSEKMCQGPIRQTCQASHFLRRRSRYPL